MKIAKKNNRNKYRVNSQIVCSEVRLIDNNNEQRGLLKIEKAQEIANNVGLDLVEISPNSNPPVCKILEYGKFL